MDCYLLGGDTPIDGPLMPQNSPVPANLEQSAADLPATSKSVCTKYRGKFNVCVVIDCWLSFSFVLKAFKVAAL